MPTPFDRLCGTRQACKALNHLVGQVDSNIDDQGKKYQFELYFQNYIASCLTLYNAQLFFILQ